MARDQRSWRGPSRERRRQTRCRLRSDPAPARAGQPALTGAPVPGPGGQAVQAAATASPAMARQGPPCSAGTRWVTLEWRGEVARADLPAAMGRVAGWAQPGYGRSPPSSIGSPPNQTGASGTAPDRVPDRVPSGDPSGTPLGTPSGDPPAGPPRGAPRPEKFSRGGAPRGPPARGPPGAPRGPPGGPLRGPPWGPLWGPLYIYFLYSRGVLGGYPPRAPPGPRGAPGPPGGKKCTFFWVFNNSPSRDKNLGFFGPPGTGQNGGLRGVSGGVCGGTPLGRVFMAPSAGGYAWDWCPRGGGCDGTLARPYARGGYVAPGWAPPSRQGAEAPRRGVAGARATRPFARAKRGPRSGVPPAAPRSPS